MLSLRARKYGKSEPARVSAKQSFPFFRLLPLGMPPLPRGSATQGQGPEKASQAIEMKHVKREDQRPAWGVYNLGN